MFQMQLKILKTQFFAQFIDAANKILEGSKIDDNVLEEICKTQERTIKTFKEEAEQLKVNSN